MYGHNDIQAFRYFKNVTNDKKLKRKILTHKPLPLGWKIFDKLEKGMGFVGLLISIFVIALFFTAFIFTRKGVDGYSLSGICHVSFYDDKHLPDYKNILIGVLRKYRLHTT